MDTLNVQTCRRMRNNTMKFIGIGKMSERKKSKRRLEMWRERRIRKIESSNEKAKKETKVTERSTRGKKKRNSNREIPWSIQQKRNVRHSLSRRPFAHLLMEEWENAIYHGIEWIVRWWCLNLAMKSIKIRPHIAHARRTFAGNPRRKCEKADEWGEWTADMHTNPHTYACVFRLTMPTRKDAIAIMCVLTIQCVLWLGGISPNSPDPFHMRGKQSKRKTSFIFPLVLRFKNLFTFICVRLCVVCVWP